jgi:hypothetical protein
MTAKIFHKQIAAKVSEWGARPKRGVTSDVLHYIPRLDTYSAMTYM